MSNPYGDYGNPYSSSGQVTQGPTSPQPPSGDVGGKVNPPAIALIVCGVIDAGYGVLNFIGHLMGGGGGQAGELPPDAPPWLRQMMEGANNTSPVIGAIFALVMIAAGALIVFGGVQMLNKKMYGLAMTAAILCILPCITCLGCCGVGEGIGIWALVILSQEDVKRAFT